MIPVGPGCWILGNGQEVLSSCRDSSESCVPRYATALSVGGASEGVSKEHLFMEITARRGRQDILVKDLGSRNGTYIMSADGWRTKMEKLTTLVLRDGDSLILGRLEVGVNLRSFQSPSTTQHSFPATEAQTPATLAQTPASAIT